MNRLSNQLSVTRLSLLFLMVACPSVASADVSLPAFFSDHMVLQQQMPLQFWGWAEAGERVSVSIGQHSVSAVADESGKWKVESGTATYGSQQEADHRCDQRQ